VPELQLSKPKQCNHAGIVQRLLCVALLATAVGCGTIREQRATNQLLLSDAVDRAVANIDFGPLAKKKVFLDSRFLQFKNDSAVTTNYVISALRQQMIVAGCLLQDSIESADYVVEARVGTMGADGHDINYGVPASNQLNAAASIVSGTPPLPTLPEISLARRTHDMAAVKIAAFAYKRESREPLWQSGTSLARSEATGTWLLGAGPFKQGSIYEGTEFAGKETPTSRWRRQRKNKDNLLEHDYVYRSTRIWDSELRERFDQPIGVEVSDFRHSAPWEPQPEQESTNGPIAVPDEQDDLAAAQQSAQQAARRAAENALRQATANESTQRQ